MEFTVRDMTYRVKKLSATRVLAIRTQADFSSVDKAENFFNALLECLEVKIDESWLNVKTPGMNSLTPVSLENDPTYVKELCEMFTEKYLQPLFHESSK